MYNEFDPIGTRIIKFIKSNILYSSLIGACFVLLVGFFIYSAGSFGKNKLFLKLETDLFDKMDKYIVSNSSDFNDDVMKFTSYTDLNYSINSKLDCMEEVGFIVETYGATKEKNLLYNCNGRKSKFLKELDSSNKLAEKYFKLNGETLVFIKSGIDYKDLGYTLVKEGFDVTSDIPNMNKAGAYYVTYNLSTDTDFYTLTRIVVVFESSSVLTNITYSFPNIVLSGGNVTINANEQFEEPGYQATDNIDGNITNYVVKTGYIDNQVPGTYVITYHVINSAGLSSKQVRYVDVIMTEEEEAALKDIIFDLDGESVIILKYGEAYVEPGYEAYDEYDNDISSKVQVSGDVNNQKAGTYQLTYTLISDSGKEKNIVRTVIVEEKTMLKVKYRLSTTSMTPNPVTIYLNIEGADYAYTVMPDETVVQTKDLSFVAEGNDEYVFIVYDKKGIGTKYTIAIENIDEQDEEFMLMCRINSNGNGFDITIDSNDTDGKVLFKYSNTVNTSGWIDKKTYTLLNTKEENIKVEAMDSNKQIIALKCINHIKNYDPIKPTTKDLNEGKVTIFEEKTTMKFWTIKKPNYYMTRIWMKDPYTQVQKFYANDIKKISTSVETLVNGLEKNGRLKNKAAVLVNNDNRSADIVYRYGNLINVDIKKLHRFRAVTSLITKDGYLKAFNNSTTMKERWGKEFIYNEYEKIKAEEPNLLITPVRPIVINGVAKHISGVSYDGDKARRTTLCQVDRNNYIVFSVPRGIYTVNQFAKIMANEGCVFGMNLDGGGSSALYIKKSTSSSFSSYLKTNGRAIMRDVLYFTE